MIYLIIFLLLLSLTFVYDCHGAAVKGRGVWVVVISAVFILLGGLRYRIGTDTVNYIYDYVLRVPPFEDLTWEYFTTTRYAKGYVILSSLFKSFTSDFTYFQFFHSLVVNTVIVRFLYKNARHVFVCLLLYFCICYAILIFQQMRESMAVALFLLSWPYFRDGKWLKYYLLVALAISFHLSATVLLLLPLVKVRGISYLFTLGARTWVIGAIVLVAAGLIQASFFKYIQMLELSEAITERATVYSHAKQFSFSAFEGGMMGWVYLTIRNVAFPAMALYCVWKRKKMQGEEAAENFRNMEAMTILSIYIGLFALFVSICGRFNNYFYLFSIVMMGDCMFSAIPAGSRLVRMRGVFWYAMLGVLLLAETKLDYDCSLNRSGTLKRYMLYYPYSSCIDQKMDPQREACFRYEKTLRIRN